MSKIELLLLIVFLLLLILLFKYLQTKRQIRNLSKQIAELVNGKSEKMLDISLIDKDLEQLAGILNQYNDNQRQVDCQYASPRKLSERVDCKYFT